MKTFITSKEEILKQARQIVSEEGIRKLNMRKAAEKSGIALGTLYNYFSDKDDLVISTIESIWHEIFHSLSIDGNLPFVEYCQAVYQLASEGIRAYPGFLEGHAAGIASSRKRKASLMMSETFVHMRKELLEVLDSDSAVKQDLFIGQFTREGLVRFVLNNMISSLIRNEQNCSFLLLMLQKVLYS